MLQFPDPCDTGKDPHAWLLGVLLTPFCACVTRICWPIDWVWQCSFLSHLMEEFVKRWHYFPLFDFSFERTNLAISSSSQTMANIPSFPVTKTHLHDPSPMSFSMTLHPCPPPWPFTRVYLSDTSTYPTSMTLSITSHLNDIFSELTQLRDKPFKHTDRGISVPRARWLHPAVSCFAFVVQSECDLVEGDGCSVPFP